MTVFVAAFQAPVHSLQLLIRPSPRSRLALVENPHFNVEQDLPQLGDSMWWRSSPLIQNNSG